MEFYNLSRGSLCLVDQVRAGANPGDKAGFLRLPSTWCEQKLWYRILESLSTEFYIAASGWEVVVHDRSEKARRTRAQWQGLSWVRYALNRRWHGTETVEVSRNGMVVSPYWDHIYRNMPKRTKNLLDYYGSFSGYQTAVDIQPCACEV